MGVGRRPKPTSLKILQGNPGRRPLNDAEPLAPKGIPEMPKGLRAAARREWSIITALLLSMGLLYRTDGKALAMYCDAYADWELAQKKCITDAIWYYEAQFDKDGNVVGRKPKEAPWFNTKCKAMKTMKSYLIEFGLTPAARAKLRVEDAQKPADLPSREAALEAAQEETDLLGTIDENAPIN